MFCAAAPLSAIETDSRICHDINTDAGLFLWDFVKETPSLPGLYQGLGEVDAESNFFELQDGSKWAAADIQMIDGWIEGDQLILGNFQNMIGLSSASTHRIVVITKLSCATS